MIDAAGPPVDFKVYRGDTFVVVFSLLNADGTPVDLFGYSAEFTARPSETYPTNTFWKTSNADELTIDVGAGRVRLELNTTETASVTADQLVYSLRLLKDDYAGTAKTGVLHFTSAGLNG